MESFKAYNPHSEANSAKRSGRGAQAPKAIRTPATSISNSEGRSHAARRPDITPKQTEARADTNGKNLPPTAIQTILNVYYETGFCAGRYWIPDTRGKWIRISDGAVRRHLAAAGISRKCEPDSPLSPMDRALVDIQHNQTVDYAGPVAGYSSGVSEINGKKVLVTDSPRLIEPKRGNWPLLSSIFEQMLVDDLVDQRPYFFGWLHTWVESLYEGLWQPGQALALAGPINTCKSLTQRIITEISGGRAAKCHQFLTDRTTFNADLFSAEHLLIEDDSEYTQARARRHLGAKLKTIAVNQLDYCHPKGKPPIVLTPRRRLTISVNDEPERLMILPPIEPDVADKLMLLRTSPVKLPAAGTAAEKADFWGALKAELPAFVQFLRSFKIPARLRSPRFGIAHFHHPSIVSALQSLEPDVINTPKLAIAKRAPSEERGNGRTIRSRIGSVKCVPKRAGETSAAARPLIPGGNGGAVRIQSDRTNRSGLSINAKSKTFSLELCIR